MNKEPKNKKLEVRLTQGDYDIFKAGCYLLGITTTEMLRMFVISTVNSIKLKIEKGEIKREDIQTLLDIEL